MRERREREKGEREGKREGREGRGREGGEGREERRERGKGERERDGIACVPFACTYNTCDAAVAPPWLSPPPPPLPPQPQRGSPEPIAVWRALPVRVVRRAGRRVGWVWPMRGR